MSPSSLPLAFSVAVFTSATLLFFVQPMVAKMLLPLFGGAASVWNTCMVFYQGALLGGYLLAHVVSRRLALGAQVGAHVGLLAVAALAALPLKVGGAGSGEANPVPALLGQLAASVGLPFFALSATGTLLQSWFARTTHPARRDPYFLYAASNAGSLLALLAYPILVEPRLAVAAQARWFTAGYAVLIALVLACGLLARAHAAPEADAEGARPEPIAPGQRGTWTALALMPSCLMMAVTHHLTTDIAPVPLLWIVPLCLYLLAFILAFARVPAGVVRAAGALAGPALLTVLFFELSEMRYPMAAAIALHLVTFFLVSFVFLARLSSVRPAAEHLTEFYLWVSLGGVLGGILQALVAPVVFTIPVEYTLLLVVAAASLPAMRGGAARRWGVELALAGAVALGTAFLLRKPLPLFAVDLTPVGNLIGFPRWRVTTLFTYLIPVGSCFALFAAGRAVAFALAMTCVAALCTVDNQGDDTVVQRARSFFSVLKVSDDKDGSCRHLLSGRTPHGRQLRAPDRRGVPLAFYSRNGPVGDVFAELSGGRAPKEVAIVGLGTGTIAAYGEPGQRFTFYEIDPEVVRIARDPALFTYLTDSKAAVDVITGDARLKLADAAPGRFGLILVDAFSSDAIPVHLLTREAIALYLDKLAPDGILALHISNRYLALHGLCARLAQDAGLVGRFRGWTGFDGWGRVSTRWVVLARSREALGKLAGHADWRAIPGGEGAPLWTDEFSNLVSILEL
jgi:hypothetical protein